MSTYYIQNNESVSEQAGDIVIAFIGDDLNNPIILNETAYSIYEFCETKKEVNEILNMIMNKFEIGNELPEKIETDIKECLKSLLNQQLIKEIVQ